MSLVLHVFADRLKSTELSTFAITVDTNVSNGYFLPEIVDQTWQIGQIVCVWDKERVCRGHVREIILQRVCFLWAE